MSKLNINWIQVIVGIIIGALLIWVYSNNYSINQMKYYDIPTYNGMISEMNAFCNSKIFPSVWNGIVRSGISSSGTYNHYVSIGCGDVFGISGGKYYIFDYRVGQ